MGSHLERLIQEYLEPSGVSMQMRASTEEL